MWCNKQTYCQSISGGNQTNPNDAYRPFITRRKFESVLFVLDILLPLIRQTFVQPAAGSNINLIAAICEWRKIIKTNLVDSVHISQCDGQGATGEPRLSIVGLCQDNTPSSHLCFSD